MTTITNYLSITLLTFLWFAAFASTGDAQDWRSIRGPHYNGSAAVDDRQLKSGPLQLKIVWKRPVGSGYSGVVSSGNRLVSAMADVKADQEFLFAMEADTGKTLWKTSTGRVMKGANGSFDGPIATPAVDETCAYHLSPFGDLAAYSLADGSVIWSRNLKKDFSAEPNFYGFGASPIIHGGVLIVAVGSPEGAVMGFDLATGKVVWKAGKDAAAFQSAVPVQIGTQSGIVVAGNTKLFAIKPETGKVIWSQPHGGAAGMPAFSVIPVPLSGGGIFLNDQRNESTVLNIGADGATKRWSGREVRNTYCVPVISGGLLCSYSSRFLTAVDPKTGKRIWRTRAPGNGFLGTVAGRLVAATLNGSLHIGDVSKDGFQEVAAIEVFKTKGDNSDGLFWSLPSFVGRSVYLRSLGAIARVDIQPGDTKTAVFAQSSEVAPGFSRFIKKVDSSSSANKQAVIDEYLKRKSLPIIEGDYVHFIIQGDYKDVAVASELFGIRQERTMKRVAGTNLFYYGVRVPESTRLSYVFYADYRPLVDPKNNRKVVSTTLTGEMEPAFMGLEKPLTFSWFDKGDIAANLSNSTDNPPKKLAGKIEHIQLESAAMKENIGLSIYLPQGYAKSDNRYPVVFVHEGKVAMESGNQAAVVDDLIQTRKIRPTIVVFIQRRFFPMQGAKGYPEMFSGELLPKISQSYRISEDRNDRASLSGGFGATLALMGTLPASGQVSRIGCHSPFSFELLHPAIQQLSKLPNDRCQVLIQWGKYEFRNPSENWNMANQAQAIAKILADGGHKVTTESIATGSDWVCWRTQSARMWQFLVGQPK